MSCNIVTQHDVTLRYAMSQYATLRVVTSIYAPVRYIAWHGIAWNGMAQHGICCSISEQPVLPSCMRMSLVY